MFKEKLKNLKISKLNIIGIISFLLSVILVLSIIKLNLIPDLLIIIISGVLILFNILCLVLINLKSKVFKISGVVISIILILISITGSYYIVKTNSFLDNSFGSNKTTKYTYYLVSNVSSKLDENNLSTDLYYYNNFDIKKIKTYLDELNEFNYIERDSLKDLFSEIKSDDNKLMVIDKSTYSLVIELEKDFEASDYKIIKTFDIRVNNKESSKVKKTFNILICGTDFAGLNDLNLIVTVNMETNKALVTTIPRAYYIEVAGRDGRKDTLSFMAPYGIDVSMKSISNYFGIDLDYYIKINTHSLVGLVDEIGGITYCSDQEYYTTHPLVLDTYNDVGRKFHVINGCQDLNGIEALTVARERKAFYDGDRTRQKNCVKIMQAIIDKMANTNTLTNYDKILVALSDLYETNIPKEQISLIAKQLISTNKKPELEMQSVDGYETRDYVHLTDLIDYVIVPYEETVHTAVAKIKEYQSIK